MFESLRRDVRHAARALMRRPAYALVTVVTLALVIGAATAVLAVVNATMIRPLPYPEADRLVRLYLQPPGTTEIRQRNPLSARVFLRFREAGLPLDAVEGFWARDRALGGDGDAEGVPGALASAGALPLLGGPLLGRTWSEEDDRANARVVVLSHGLWQRRYGGDTSILGRTVIVDRVPHVVIGVMPPGFQAIYIESELWTPLNAVELGNDNPSSTFIQTVVRRAPGVSLDQLRTALEPAMARVVAEAPNALRGWTAGADGVRELQFALQRPALLVLLVAVGALTLLACANLANVTLAEVVSRRSETAIRTALGAGRGRVIRLQLVESLILAVTGGGAGLLVGTVTLPLLLSLDPQTAKTLGDVHVDWRVQGAIALLAAAITIAAGVLPLVRELGADVARGLTDAVRRAVGSRRDKRFRRVLVGTEAALAIVLLACGALLMSGFDKTARTSPGFDRSHVLGAQLRLPPSAYPTEAARNDVVTRILERVRAAPGVLSAGTTLNLFQPGFAYQTLVHIEGRPTPDGQPHTVQFRRVSPGYFRTLRIPLLRGRDFAATDGSDSPGVVVVSRAFGERFWPGEDPVGRRVLRNTQTRMLTVVGVVGDVSDVGFGQAPEPTLYVPYTQNNPVIAPVSLTVRTAGDPMSLAGAIRAAVLSVDPAQPLDHVTTLDRFLENSLGPERFRTMLLLVLGALGLLMAVIGVYGVTVRLVEERTREVGLRLALGAAPSSVWLLVVGHALAAVTVGMAVGSLTAVAAGAALMRLLPGLDRAEPWSVVPAVTALALSALTAAALPASRAVRVNPTTALRGE